MKRAHLKALALLALTTLVAGDALADDKLARLAMQRDLEGVKQMLSERGADINALGPYETPALHWLVRIEEHDLVRKLLDAGANPNLPTGYGLQALSIAIENKDTTMVELLLSRGANANQADRVGETPLMLAARAGSLPITQALVKAGARIEVREPNYQQNALMIAVRAGATDVTAFLLSKGADVNAITTAGGVPQMRLPSQNAGSKGVGINRGGWPERGQRAPVGGAKTPLLYATRMGNLALVKQLVEAGAKLEVVDANGVTPLLNTILNASVSNQPRRKTEHLEIARYLIERGADVNAADWYGETPLWAAVDLRNLDVSGPEKDNGIDREGTLGLIKLLLAKGANPDARVKEYPPEHRWITRLGSLSWVDFTGQTAFLRAALAGDVTTMKVLLEHGANPNIATFDGTTALMAAAGVNWTVSQTYDEGKEALLEAVKLAHSAGNDVNAVNSMGLTAVHGAANRGSNDIIEWLAQHGARLDVADKQGRTPLIWAHGVFLATHPPVDKPETATVIEKLMIASSK